MLLITVQTEISIRIVKSKIGKGDHTIAVNLIAPDVGVVVDGHHGYMASMIDHKPLRIVVAGLNHSDNKVGQELLDYWKKLFGKEDFYELLTGRLVTKKFLRETLQRFPHYRYAIDVVEGKMVYSVEGEGEYGIQI